MQPRRAPRDVTLPAVDVVSPQVAAALSLVGRLDRDDRPMLAAHWLAAGLDGETLRDVAWRSAGDRDVDDLWPAALAEAGAPLPASRPRRTAATWAAEKVLSGQQDARWLVELLWPPNAPDDVDEELDAVVYTIDDCLDYADRALTGENGYHPSEAEQPLAEVRAAVEALARDDVPAAWRVLDHRRP